MLVLDGYEATKFIRNELKLVDLPIVVLSADVLRGTKEEVQKYGMNDYIAKPID